ncbi:MAG: SAM-dependent methyltransferase, partial [Actinomycetota bacterium]|nr:SAM-dependent methyltransferase [Actinomycetota bacterium]
MAVQQAWPGVVAAAQAGQEFGRTVTWYAAFSRGIRQVLDVGAMLPVPGLVSEAGRQVLRDCRVVRVASGPAAVGAEAGTGAAHVCADVRDPAALLAAAGEVLDFAAPMLVLLVSVLDFVADDDSPARIVENLAAVLAPGSLIAVSHLTADQAPSQVSAGVATWNARIPAAWRPRSRAEVAALFGGLPLLLP